MLLLYRATFDLDALDFHGEVDGGLYATVEILPFEAVHYFLYSFSQVGRDPRFAGLALHRYRFRYVRFANAAFDREASRVCFGQ